MGGSNDNHPRGRRSLWLASIFRFQYMARGSTISRKGLKRREKAAVLLFFKDILYTTERSLWCVLRHAA
jgi:hypothetical protein